MEPFLKSNGWSITCIFFLFTFLIFSLPSFSQAEPPHVQVRPVGPGVIAIDWEHPNDGAEAITLERENPAFTWVFVALVNSFNDLGLEASHSYRYRVCALYNRTPDCTPWIATQTLSSVPSTGSSNPVPGFTGISAGPNSITVSWNAASDYGRYNVRWGENGLRDVQTEVKGNSFTAKNLSPGTYHFIVQGCRWRLLGSSCSSFSAPIEIATEGAVAPTSVPAPAVKGIIYGVTLNDDLLWYRHAGRADGTFVWGAGTGNKVGAGWTAKHIFSGGGKVIYVVTDNGDLLWYHHEGHNDGTFRWTSNEGKKVGSGWNFKQVFSGDNGIIYGVTDGGDLLWYRHVGQADGSVRWEGPKKVGTGWGEFAHVFSGGGNVIYAVTPFVPASEATGIGPGMGRHPASGGDLLWYRHVGQEDGSFRWEGPKKVGTGWNFRLIFGDGDGVIYAIADNGDLLWYRHVGQEDGSFRWEGPKKVGSGWWKFSITRAFAG